MKKHSSVLASLLAGLLATTVQAAPPVPAQQWPPPPTAAPGGALPSQPGGALPRPGPNMDYLPSPQVGALTDAFGRFRVALPAGTEQVNATYVFAVPSAVLQINVSVATRDAMFQSSIQMYAEMMRKSGSQVEQQNFDHRGRQALMVMARMREPQSGTQMQSLNVFLPGPNVWLQVSGPEQSAAQIESTMRGLLDGLQTP